MQFDILEVLSYTVVFITILTMIFGIVAYYLYKIREKRRTRRGLEDSLNESEDDKYLYFRQKELLL